MIKPKVAQKSLQTQEDLLRNVNLVNSRSVKFGGIIVGYSDSKNSKKLKQLTEDKRSSDYEVFVLRVEHPKIRVVGISSCLDKE